MKKSYLANRKEVLMDTIFSSWDKMLSLSLLSGIFFLPLVIFSYINSFAIMKINDEIANSSAEALDNLSQKLLSLEITSSLIMIPLLIIMAIGLGGTFYYMRRKVWGENIDFFKDFFKGVKNNLLNSIYLGLVLGITYSLSIYMYHTLIRSGLKIIYIIIAFILLLLIISFLFSFLMFNYSLNQVYEMKFTERLKNSLMFTIYKYPMCLALSLISFLPLVLIFILPLSYGVMASLLLYTIYFIGIVSAIWTLYSHKVFDKYINEISYPHLVNKGFYPGGIKDESNS